MAAKVKMVHVSSCLELQHKIREAQDGDVLDLGGAELYHSLLDEELSYDGIIIEKSITIQNGTLHVPDNEYDHEDGRDCEFKGLFCVKAKGVKFEGLIIHARNPAERCHYFTRGDPPLSFRYPDYMEQEEVHQWMEIIMRHVPYAIKVCMDAEAECKDCQMDNGGVVVTGGCIKLSHCILTWGLSYGDTPSPPPSPSASSHGSVVSEPWHADHERNKEVERVEPTYTPAVMTLTACTFLDHGILLVLNESKVIAMDCKLGGNGQYSTPALVFRGAAELRNCTAVEDSEAHVFQGKLVLRHGTVQGTAKYGSLLQLQGVKGTAEHQARKKEAERRYEEEQERKRQEQERKRQEQEREWQEHGDEFIGEDDGEY